MQQIATDEFDDFDMFAMFDDLIVSPDLQPIVDDMQAAGMTNQAILSQLVSGRMNIGCAGSAWCSRRAGDERFRSEVTVH